MQQMKVTEPPCIYLSDPSVIIQTLVSSLLLATLLGTRASDWLTLDIQGPHTLRDHRHERVNKQRLYCYGLEVKNFCRNQI